MAQSLDRFQWKNRILLVLSADPVSENVRDQWLVFEGQEQELKERKLLVLFVTPPDLQVFPASDFGILYPENVFEEFKRSDASMEIVLIGLDGSVKLRRDKVLSAKELYAVIDVMPMRRAELDRNQ